MFVSTSGLFLLYTNEVWPAWALFLLNIVIFAIGLKIAYFILKKVILQLTKRTKNEFDDELIAIIEYPLLAALILIFFTSALSIFNLSETIMNYIYLAQKCILLIILTWFLYSLIGIIYEHVFVRIAQKSESNLDDQIFPIVRKVLRIALIIFAAIYFLDILGVNITPLLAGVGIGGIAIAFAAQKILGDAFGGVSILADNAFNLGDKVKIDKHEGEVKEIGLRSTVLKTQANTKLILPNSFVANSVIENQSFDFNKPKKTKIK
jgi:MscS family membrane protein